jgi:hypothetical protein
MNWMEMMRKPSHVAAVLAALVVVVGCGSSTGRRLTPIPPLAGGSRGGAAAMPAIGFPSPGTIVYRVGTTLPSLPIHATVYRADEATTAARVARLAEALGLSGAVREDTSGWTVQGGKLSLQVQRTGWLPWTLSSSGAGSVSAGCAGASPASSLASGVTSPSTSAVPPPICPTTTTVPGLPTRADAERRARDVLTSAGFDLNGATTSSTGGNDSWDVSFIPTLARVPVLGTEWSVTIGANGSVLSASGWLADPVAVGDYPLVGVTAGLKRLQEGGTWIVYSGPVPMLGGLLAGASGHSVAGPTTTGPTTAVPPTGTATPGGAPESTPGSGPAVPPSPVVCQQGQPCAPIPATTTPISVPPVVVRITGVHLALAWAGPLGLSSPDAWLVPVYVFELTAGTAYPFFGNGVPVLAVADRYVAAPPSTAMPTGVTKRSTGPTAITVVTTPAPGATATKHAGDHRDSRLVPTPPPPHPNP